MIDTQDPHARAYLVTVLLVVVGWTVAAIVYFHAAPPDDDPLRQFHDSKSYQQQVERFGGKATVFANDLTDWIASLFRGQNLAFTIAGITLMVAFGYFFRATRRTPDAS
jgi:hypothetical protein